jgi:hypothetical protein
MDRDVDMDLASTNDIDQRWSHAGSRTETRECIERDWPYLHKC